MKRPDAPLASDGYYSMNSAYETFGVGAKLLERLASEAGLELPLRKFGPQTVKAISLQQIDQLKEQYPDAFAPPLPDEHFSVKGAAKELGVDFYTVKRIVDEYEWDLPRYKFKGGVVSGAIGRKKLEQIRKHPNITAKSKDATTAISLNVLSREVGMSPATVKDIAKEKGIELGEYRFGKGRTRGRGFSLAEAEIIKSAVIAPMPEEWLRPKDAAKELGIHYQSLIKIVDALGLELPQRKTKNGRLGNAVSPQQMQAIRESERYQLVITKKHWTQR